MRIGLMQSNLETAEGYLMAVSHPGSPNYGNHWTADEVHEMFAPEDQAVQDVVAWLNNAGVGNVVHSDNKGWLAFDIPASQAEELFKTHYHEHNHQSDTSSAKVKIGCDHYYVPEHLAHHIDYVTPGVVLSPSFTRVKQDVKRTKRTPQESSWHGQDGEANEPLRARQPEPVPDQWEPPYHPELPADLQDCGRNVTPACIKALYGIPDAPIDVSDIDSLGIFEDSDAYNQEDLDLFYTQWAKHVPNGTRPDLKSVDGGQAPVPLIDLAHRSESTIDLGIAYALTYPQKITLYQVDDDVQVFTNGFYNTFLDALDGSYCTYSAYGVTGNTDGYDAIYPDPDPDGGYKGKLMCGTYKPTRVISISYGPGEYDFPLNYTKRQCNELLKLGLQGVTFFWASGDDGVASYNGCLGKNQTVFSPSFPTCPYVTNVGATRLYDDQTVLDKESALHIETGEYGGGYDHTSSAGGFSNYFAVPQYQQSAVASYFSNHDPGLPYYTATYNATAITNLGEHGGLYNRVGRGYPDVSANGCNFLISQELEPTKTYGASISAPIWASLITLINQERTKCGKGPVGFINPVLYANPWAMNDIVNGSNPGCGSSGFQAVPGWDPVTGLGTPNYPKLSQLFNSLP
ncbi:unnamed protein product [Zymoseptoria tritici ST99CH_3D1]|nr:unnamed protein product [Zymoseptoria tritici ST99CH_3D1]